MEMPTICQKCNKLFDLEDGQGSVKWFPDFIICEKCGYEEDEEIERDEQIKESNLIIDDALFDIREHLKVLKKLGVNRSITIIEN